MWFAPLGDRDATNQRTHPIEAEAAKLFAKQPFSISPFSAFLTALKQWGDTGIRMVSCSKPEGLYASLVIDIPWSHEHFARRTLLSTHRCKLTNHSTKHLRPLCRLLEGIVSCWLAMGTSQTTVCCVQFLHASRMPPSHQCRRGSSCLGRSGSDGAHGVRRGSDRSI